MEKYEKEAITRKISKIIGNIYPATTFTQRSISFRAIISKGINERKHIASATIKVIFVFLTDQ